MSRPRKSVPRPEPAGLSIAAQRQQLADSGDIDALWTLLQTSGRSMIDWERTFNLLLRAIDVKARSDPQAFAQREFARMASLTSYFIFRIQHILNRKLRDYELADSLNGPIDLPSAIVEDCIPKILELQNHLAHILQAQASVARQHELIRSKRLRNERVLRSQVRRDRMGATSETEPRETACRCGHNEERTRKTATAEPIPTTANRLGWLMNQLDLRGKDESDVAWRENMG